MYTYKKSERLCNKKLTENLFLKGSSISLDSFRLVHIENENQDVLLKSQIIVPKRNIVKAVDRNFIKRQIRESFRKNKHVILDSLKKSSTSLNIAIVYQESSRKPSIVVEEEIKRLNFSKLGIMRPSFLLGDRKEKRIGEKIGIFVFKMLSPLFVGPIKKMKPIHSEVVAKAMIAIAQSDTQQITFESNEISEIII